MSDKREPIAIDARTLSAAVLRQLASEAEARERGELEALRRAVEHERAEAQASAAKLAGVDLDLPPHLRALARGLPPIVPLEDAARALNVHSKTLKRWIASGRLVATQASEAGRILITREAVLALLDPTTR